MIYWKSPWAYVDVLYTVLNFTVTLSIMGHFSLEFFRKVQAFLALVVWGKCLYFLQLIDDIAPLIHIIFRIFSDIKWFVILLAIEMFAFANCFYLIGKNQLQYDSITKDERPLYTTLVGSFEQIYMFCLGEVTMF